MPSPVGAVECKVKITDGETLQLHDEDEIEVVSQKEQEDPKVADHFRKENPKVADQFKKRVEKIQQEDDSREFKDRLFRLVTKGQKEAIKVETTERSLLN